MVEALALPAVPVMVIAVVPMLAFLVALRVRTLEDVVGLLEKEAVTSLGNPDRRA